MEKEMIRARSPQQKQERLMEIMTITDEMFSTTSYHEITLTTIAKALGWSRGNLYKYVNTKEEIFLELYLVKQAAFMAELQQSCPLISYPSRTLAYKISQCFDHHRAYLRYHNILSSIIETNVTVEKLAKFKKQSYTQRQYFFDLLTLHCPSLSPKEIKQLFLTFLYQGCGLDNHTHVTSALQEAMALAQLEFTLDDFSELFADFITMCLEHYPQSSK